jgi:hypothetical protein
VPFGRRRPIAGLGKLIVVAVVAAAIGAGIGVGLADLTSDDTTTVAAAPTAPVTPPAPVTPVAPAVPPAAVPTTPPAAPTTSTTTTATTATTTTATTATTATPAQTTKVPPAASRLVPRVEIASATIGRQSTQSGEAIVTASVAVVNRFGHALALTSPVLVSGSDETKLAAADRSLAQPLLGTLAPGQSAAGTLRFTVARDVATRLLAAPRAQLRIAGRTVALKLATTPG